VAIFSRKGAKAQRRKGAKVQSFAKGLLLFTFAFLLLPYHANLE
jgi:hypothetical protein